MTFSPELVTASYVVRLKFPDGSLEELSGFDCNDLNAARRWREVVLRWLHGKVLYAHALPKGTSEYVFDLRRWLRRAVGVSPLDVSVEVVAVLVGLDRGRTEEVVCPAPHEDDWRPDRGGGEPQGPHLENVNVRAKRW